MYKTVQAACKQAKAAHNKEKRVHVIFREVGLWRIRPVEEIEAINEKSVYGWTVSSWIPQLHPDMGWNEYKRLAPMGDDCIIRKQFYKDDGHYSPELCLGIKTFNNYTKEEIRNCIINGQQFD